jgi:predicted nucleic acid-binding protein
MIVLDTSVLIDVLRRDEGAVRFATSLEEVPVCSEITRVEILRGLRTQERRPAERLFASLRWAPVDEAVARHAGELGRSFRASHRAIDTADLIVAATAKVLDARLATMNVRDFPMFKNLRPPY